ncbi:MAG: hypothetical protein ACRDF5_08480 [bacterium]
MPDAELRAGLGRLVERVAETLVECGDAYPYAADPGTGRWFTTADGNWCGGHWVSMLWMAYDLTGERRFRDAALARTEPLRPKLAADDMFRGFTFYYTGARGWEIAGWDWQRELALAGARAMAQMYEATIRQMPIGNEVSVLSAGQPLRGRAISAVDNIYACLILPWWAWRQTAEPRFREICVAHADRTMELFIRPDRSTDEFIEFDLSSGVPRRRFTRLGFADDSCWARGQAWCIAGLALAYEYTRESRYLQMAAETTRYFMDRSPSDHVPYYDFADPHIPQVERDSSAAAIVGAALVRLLTLPAAEPAARALADVGRRVACSLVQGYLTSAGADQTRRPGMLLHGCFNRPGRVFADHELIWGDHYLMEALYVLHRAEEL